jgi:hypothetical protein
MRRGQEGRWFDVGVYLAATVVFIAVAAWAGGGGWLLVAVLPFGFAVWRANVD